MLLRICPSFKNLFQHHFFYEIIKFWFKWSCRQDPLLCAECCFGMQICFWYGALLHCTIVHYLAPPWSQTDLPWPITTRNFRGGGATYTIEHLWHLANVPCKHADVGKSKKREKIKQLIMASMLAPLAHTLRSEQLQHSQMFSKL